MQITSTQKELRDEFYDFYVQNHRLLLSDVYENFRDKYIEYITSEEMLSSAPSQ